MFLIYLFLQNINLSSTLFSIDDYIAFLHNILSVESILVLTISYSMIYESSSAEIK